MTELFNGGEMDAFSPADGDCYESTSSGTFNSSFARCAIRVDGSTSYAQTPNWGNTTELWVHCDLYVDTFAGGGAETTFISGYNNAGTEVYRLRASHSSGVLTFKAYYWNGASFTQIGSTFTTQTDVLNTFDLYMKFDASGSIKVFLSGTERLTGTADTSSIAGVAYVRLRGSLNTYYSQVMADTESTIGHRLMTRPPTGVGATSSWTGTYTEIDETVYSDADFINSGTANQVSTFAITAPTLTGYIVQSVTVSARAKRDASGPQNLRLALRSSGTDYFSGSDKALTVGYAPYQTIWETNPATSAAWVNNAISSVQPGVKSIT